MSYLGFMKVQLTMENGERWSTDKMLYKKHNHALTILTHALATKVSLLKKYRIFHYMLKLRSHNCTLDIGEF